MPAVSRFFRGLVFMGVAIGGILVLAVTFAASVVLGRFGGSAQLPADCAIVFGAAVYGTRAGPAVVRRVAQAAELYREGLVRTLYLTGGLGHRDRISEATSMAREAVQQGVHATDIVLEEASRSTWENLQNTRPLTASCATVVGISDQFHLARIELIADRQGWEQFSTYGARIRPQQGTEIRSIFRETLAYLYYFFRVDRLWNIHPAA